MGNGDVPATMGSTLTIVLLGVAFAALQLAAGIVIGRYLPWRERRAPGAAADPVRLQRLARRLCQVTSRVADDVGQHQAHMEQATRDLLAAASADGSDVTEVVLATIAGVMKINERLQHRLSDAEEKLQRQARQIESHLTEARTDSLTGLPNRRAFDDELIRRLAEWQRKRNTFCLMLIDVDHFKALNDRYGHPAGDHVLRHLAEVLKASVREMDMVARVGGEEFAVILPSTASRDARQAAERIRATVARTPTRYEQAELHVTVSLGLAMVEQGEDYTTLMRRVDEALYASKRAGRNCGHFHNGQACERILPESTSRDVESPPGPSPPDGTPARSDPETGKASGADLAQLFNDLRARLAEVAEN